MPTTPSRRLGPADDPRADRIAARFWAHVRKTRRCWLWEGPVRGSFGRISIRGMDWTAHRAAWTLSGRTLPAGGTLWRKCGNTRCVRPEHMSVSRRKALPRAATSPSVERAFWARVERSKGCWRWRGVMQSGYGRLRVGGRYVQATQLAWALTRGPIPPGRFIVIRCGNRGCVRPEHLRLGEPRTLHAPIEERLWSRVRKTRHCWLWQGARLPAGNGVICWQGRSRPVARVVWQLAHGQIPRGKRVLHTCFNPACVRPGHLRLGTASDLFRLQLRTGRHWSQVHPESHPRGDDHPFRLHPEIVPRGEASSRAKLTEEAVRDIRRRYGRAGNTYRKLGKEYGVHPTTIGYAARRTTWRHVR